MATFNYPYGYMNTGGYNYQPPITQNYFAWVQGEAAAQAFQVAFGNYVYDIELTDESGHVTIILLSKLKLTKEVY